MTKLKKDKIKIEELNDFLLKEICPNIPSTQTKSIMLDGRVVKTNKSNIEEAIKLITKNSFSNKEVITFNDILQLKYKLFLLIAYYEFYRIREEKDNKISTENVARVFISYINMFKSKQVLDKLNNGGFNLSGEFNFNEFVCFFWFCSCP